MQRNSSTRYLALSALLPVFAIGTLTGPAWSQAVRPVQPSIHAQGAHSPDVVIVRFATRMDLQARDAELRKFSAHRVGAFDRLVPGLEVWRLPKGASLDSVLSQLKRNPAVRYAEVDHLLQKEQVFPNDTRFGDMWHLHNTGQFGGTVDADIDMPEAWQTSTGDASVVVGVIDTGTDYNHVDLAANMWVNPGEIPGNGIDDDGNGFVDDVHGWNAFSNNGDPMDTDGHGTHTSGTVGARGNNGIGTTGVCWDVKIMAIKFLGPTGGTTAGAIASIDYAVAQKNRGVNLKVLNNSWGGGGFNQGLLDSINAAAAADILFVAAAGNSGLDTDISPHYPSSYTAANIVSVANTDNNDARSFTSNFGSTSVDLGAPGSSVLSTAPGNSYVFNSGTSMAAPHVAGAAALLLAVDPSLTYAQLKTALMDSGDPVASMSGVTVSGKRLNVASAIATLGPPVPDFQMAIGPSSASVNQGQSASFTVSTTAVNGFVGNVTLSNSSVPALAGATISFSPNPVAAGSSSTMTVATTTGTAAGNYNLTVTGVSGALTHNTSAILNVDPQGTVTVSYSNPSVISIPDNSPAGITSTISVPDSLTIISTTIAVDITHTYIGDLIVAASSPLGTQATLHNRAGGSADNLHETYTVATFDGQNSAGTWTLSVSDNAGIDIGTLDNWTLTIKGTPDGTPPDTTAPSVSITAPADGSTVGGTVSVTATASDNVGVTEVRFFVDGTLLSTDATSPYSASWDTTAEGNGAHSLTAQALDAAGNVGNSGAVNVTVSNVASDTVTITRAQFDSRKGKLQVQGRVSSDNSTLIATFPGGSPTPIDNDRGRFKEKITGVASNPGTITVTSSGGGSDTVVVTNK